MRSRLAGAFIGMALGAAALGAGPTDEPKRGEAAKAETARHEAATDKAARHELDGLTEAERLDLLKRAQVWRDVPTATLDVARGPDDVKGFAPGADVTCDFHEPDEVIDGATPKFDCAVGPKDVVRVKHTHEEVRAEVAATRLFWALGFGADRMYPAHVTCKKCPEEPIHGKAWVKRDARVFDLAALERRLPGKVIASTEKSGWAWPELDLVDEAAGGAPLAHRDALKLLAVLVQHSDTKREQQRFLCLKDGVEKDAAGNETCRQPFLYVNDLGLSFGNANTLNTSRVNLAKWEAEPVWKDAARCVGNLKKSFSGTMDDPVISEAGRAFLAARLALLTDAQMRTIFTIARMGEEVKAQKRPPSPVDEWVRVLKKKRDEIASARCPR